MVNVTIPIIVSVEVSTVTKLTKCDWFIDWYDKIWNNKYCDK